MSTVERFEGVTVKVETTDSGYELDKMGIIMDMDKHIWVAVKDENVIHLKGDGDYQNMCNSENVEIAENEDVVVTDDNISFQCSLCSFCSNIQSVVEQHVIEHISTNSTSQGHFQVQYEENVQENLSHSVTNGSEDQKMDSVGQGHFDGDSVVVVNDERVCQDDITQLEPEVPIPSNDVTITIQSEATPDSNEVNSREIVCEKCSLHANDHADMVAGEQCPICNSVCTRRGTLTRHLPLKNNMNIDGMQLNDTVDINCRHCTTNKIQPQRTNSVTHSYRTSNKMQKQKMILVPYVATRINRASYPHRLKRIVDVQTIISAEEIKWQLEDTRDILRPKDLAPATKSMMERKKKWGIEKLFAHPSRPMLSKKLIQRFVDRLTTVPVGNEDIKTC